MAIVDKPSDYFNTKLYAASGSGQSITGVGFQPDWVWIKARSDAGGHALYDSVRGTTKRLASFNSNAEGTVSGGVTAFDADGFTVGNDGDVNSASSIAAWNWKAGGSASNNTDGNTTTSVSVNQDAGFSIMKYAGDGNDSTIGHGLGAKPEYIIFKEIDGAESWRVWSKYTPDTASKALALNLTDAAFSQSGWIGAISTSTISIGTDSSINTNGNNYIAYAFAPKQGYSKFGSYVGSGSAPGTFSYLGFKPAFLLMKESDGADGWGLYDNKRNPSNTTSFLLQANSSGAESNAVANTIDFLSNGFKVCASGTQGNFINESGKTYIYMAFAENPFVTSTGVPATAR